jgi:uncharacterized protein (UPF0332 family)
MSFDWRNYLVLAKVLHGNCNTISHEEACLRAAVSRAYYAAFCTARNLACNKGSLSLSNTGQDHKLVMDHYRKDPDLDRRRVGSELKRLRDLRNLADYQNTVTDVEGSVQNAIDASQEVIDLLDKIFC